MNKKQTSKFSISKITMQKKMMVKFCRIIDLSSKISRYEIYKGKSITFAIIHRAYSLTDKIHNKTCEESIKCSVLSVSNSLTNSNIMFLVLTLALRKSRRRRSCMKLQDISLRAQY